jgi:hypothetical protein
VADETVQMFAKAFSNELKAARSNRKREMRRKKYFPALKMKKNVENDNLFYSIFPLFFSSLGYRISSPKARPRPNRIARDREDLCQRNEFYSYGKQKK